MLSDIAKGHINELLSHFKLLSPELEKTATDRLNICKQCPVMSSSDLGLVCDSKKGGCGCRLAAKTKLKSAECPINKW